MSGKDFRESSGTMRVIGASVRGSRHIRSGQPCQDSVRWRFGSSDGLCGNTLIVAVADGAGSAPHSDQGSQAAANASTDAAFGLLCQYPHPISPEALRGILIASLSAARKELSAIARREKRQINAYATTLLVAIHTHGALAVAQIGDGGIVASRDNTGYELLVAPQHGEYANETIFITRRASVAAAQTRVIPNYRPRSIAMFTDGIQSLVLDARDGPPGTPHPPFFFGAFAWLKKQPDDLHSYTGLRDFLRSPQVMTRTDDDVTLLLAVLEQG